MNINIGSSDILTDFGQFISKLFNDITSGLLFFGGLVDVVVAVLDILVTALVIYYILKILRDSRAWQLLKGLILIVGFAIICSVAGLSTVGFLLNNTISVLAIAFVVIFQPELRRALETFGRNSFNVFTSALTPEDSEKRTGSVHNLIESIVRACEKMAETRTGGLIILERQTRLSELVEQENVVQLDAAVSATMLLQIFYKGSPLHDGAALIRDGRLTAARIHVPLSDNYHVRKDYGTRHRAAVGASEMGDAISIVVSEEHGTIGVALEGRLYLLESADALRTLLHKLLSGERSGMRLGGFFRATRRQGRDQAPEQPVGGNGTNGSGVEAGTANLAAGTATAQSARMARPGSQRQPSPIPRRQRLLLMIFSLAIAIVLWLYVQVTLNPVDSKNFQVALDYRGLAAAALNGYTVQSTDQNIQVTIQARKNILENLTADDVQAYVDCSAIADAGPARLPVLIETSSLRYVRTSTVTPKTIDIMVSPSQGG